MALLRREYGNSGLQVSALGLGAGQIGDASLDEAEVGRLLHGAIDAGVNLFDSARGYGLSEERIGRHLKGRRAEIVLSTKVGYGIAGRADWTWDCIVDGVNEALQRLQTDHIDIVHLHSCPLATLQSDEVIRALEQVRAQGKIRVAAYSGENGELAWAVHSGRFGGVECSVNLFDQQSLHYALPHAAAHGIGVIAKRAVANTPWRFSSQPHGQYCETYWQRWQTMGLPDVGIDLQELALRFSAYAPGVSAAIVGTTRLEHLQHNVALVEQGPLPQEWLDDIRQRFQLHGQSWDGQV